MDGYVQFLVDLWFFMLFQDFQAFFFCFCFELGLVCYFCLMLMLMLLMVVGMLSVPLKPNGREATADVGVPERGLRWREMLNWHVEWHSWLW